MSVHERVFRSLLVVYPREHRREFGEPMTQLLRDRLRDEGGGVRTAAVWVNVGLDVVVTALAERRVATMGSFRNGWWRYTAGFVAAGITVLGIGNLFASDDGPMSGKYLAAAVALLAAALVVAGLRIRPQRKALGSILIGLGTLPGATMVVVLWFIPVFLFGVLSLITTGAAFGDAARREQVQAAG